MPTPEEIDKLSAAYADAMCSASDYCDGVHDELYILDLMANRDDAKSVLEWLSKDYCIVPKNEVI